MKKILGVVAALAILGIAIYYLRATPQHDPSEPPEISISTATSEFTPAVKTAPPTVAPPQVYPAPATQNFEQLVHETEAALPTFDQMRQLGQEEAHHAPAAIMKAGAEIGDVVEAIENDPSQVPKGLEFFGRCARRNDIDPTVRALCLFHLRDISRQTSRKLNEQDISPEIRALSDKLRD